MTFDEALRPITGYEGCYSVTPDGRVRSDRNSRWLVSFIGRHGYPAVTLSVNGRTRQFLVHRLVALAWIPNDDPARKTQVNHLSGVKSDNRRENLEWCTPGQNHLHAFRTLGRSIGAAQREHAKRMGTATRTLTPEQVRDARGRAAGGETLTSVAASLGLCIATTHSLIHRRTYRDI